MKRPPHVVSFIRKLQKLSLISIWKTAFFSIHLVEQKHNNDWLTPSQALPPVIINIKFLWCELHIYYNYIKLNWPYLLAFSSFSFLIGCSEGKKKKYTKNVITTYVYNVCKNLKCKYCFFDWQYFPIRIADCKTFADE